MSGCQVRESGPVASVSSPGGVGLCWGHLLGLQLRPSIMKSIPCLGPSLARAPPLLPAVSPESPGAVLCLRVCSHSSAAFFHSPGQGVCVCAASFSTVCGLCQSVGQPGVYVSLWTRVHGVAVLCSIKLSYT